MRQAINYTSKIREHSNRQRHGILNIFTLYFKNVLKNSDTTIEKIINKDNKCEDEKTWLIRNFRENQSDYKFC